MSLLNLRAVPMPNDMSLHNILTSLEAKSLGFEMLICASAAILPTHLLNSVGILQLLTQTFQSSSIENTDQK